MFRFLRFLCRARLCALLCLLSPPLAAQNLVSFGADTPAGRGGQVLRVTTLAASGPGSLREALATPGPRIIVFEVGGIIDLDKSDLRINQPFVTIAGQTAPSPGITLIRGGLRITTHDVKMQHIRVRIGDAGEPRRSGFERDVSIEGPRARNIVIDHCSFAWGTDENLSVSGERYAGPEGTAGRITLSNNIIAEGLNDSTHVKGMHSMGSLIHDEVQEVAIIGNLYAHNADRNPWFKGNATGVVLNNLIYNPGSYGIRVGANPREWVGRPQPAPSRIAAVGNVLRHGVDTRRSLGLVRTNTDNGEAFLADNLAFNHEGQPMPMTEGRVTLLTAAPLWSKGFSPLPASEVEEAVLRSAGARPKERDAVDARIVADVRARRGRIIDSQEQVGGYPRTAPTQRRLELPAEGIEEWLRQLAQALE